MRGLSGSVLGTPHVDTVWAVDRVVEGQGWVGGHDVLSQALDARSPRIRASSPGQPTRRSSKACSSSVSPSKQEFRVATAEDWIQPPFSACWA
ncbi:hypothetical protein STENM223S_09005 [Streptomyces tendae]